MSYVSMAISADSQTEKPQNLHFWPIFSPVYMKPPLARFSHSFTLYAQCRCVLYYFGANRFLTTQLQQPFYGRLSGLPEWAGTRKTLTHPPSWSSSILYQLLLSATIHNILLVQITCLAIFLHNLLPCPVWSTSWSAALRLIFRSFLHPISVFFSLHMPIPSRSVLL